MADLKEKTYVEDVDRSVYDIRDAENDAYRMESGLTPEIVEKLSTEKDDPVWMQQFRLESLQIYNEMKIPNWGPSIEGLDMDHIATYVRPNTKMRNDWKDVPEDIKETFERLGIPQAERKSCLLYTSPSPRDRSENPSPVWVRSTTPSLSITTSRIPWRPRAWFTPIWRAP